MPHQLFPANNPPVGASLPLGGQAPLRRSTLASLSTPQAQGSLSPTTPQCPSRKFAVLREI